MAQLPDPSPWRVPTDPDGWSRYVRGLQAHLGLGAHAFGRRVRASPNAVAAWRRGGGAPTGAQVLRTAVVAVAEGYAHSEDEGAGRGPQRGRPTGAA